MATFHLSLPVPDPAASRQFFAAVLGAQVTHVDASGYINLELAGVQLTLVPATSPASAGDLHFGVNLDVAEFNALAERVRSLTPHAIVEPPTIVDAGTPRERHKLYLACPAGYRIEIKGMKR